MERLTRSPLALLAAALIGAALLWGGLALTGRSPPPGDRAQIEAIVRDYVLANPEIIPEAMERLKTRETAKTIEANKRAIFEPFGNAWLGNPNGDVTVVEYFDYNCGYCRASLPTIAQLIAADPKVKVVLREWPILSAESESAARLSLAAAEQGRFEPFHKALYALGPVSAQSLASAARTAGVDMARARTITARADVELATNTRVARELGMTGTPSWVIGTQVVSSAMPLEDLQKAVKAARDAK